MRTTPRSAFLACSATLVVLLLVCISFPAHAQNIVSRPVGFVRIAVESNTAVLVSAPFHAANVPSNAITTWDAANQEYAASEAAALPQPGQGFWVRSASGDAVFLAGELALDPTNYMPLAPGLNLVGYPYASAMRVEDTALAAEELSDSTGINAPSELRVGEGYWLNLAGTETRVWAEVRPYADVFPANDEPPAIENVEVVEGRAVTLRIRGSGVAEEQLEVFWQDLEPDGRFDPGRGWSVVTESPMPDGAGAFFWTDNGSSNRVPVDEVFARYYLVGRADVDVNENGIPDARERFVHGVEDIPVTYAVGGNADELAASSVTASETEFLMLEELSANAATNLGTFGGTNEAANLPPVAMARIIYVDQWMGNDQFTGTRASLSASDGPKRTVRGGLGAVEDGGFMVIRSGVYSENLTIAGRACHVTISGRVSLNGAIGTVAEAAPPPVQQTNGIAASETTLGGQP